MHRSRLGALGIDCRSGDLEAHARFWSEALGYEIGGPDPDEDGPSKYVPLRGPEGEVQIFLQKVDHESRVHLDIETDDIEAEVARLEKLGAKRIANIKRWVVMEAPSGHRFCVVRPQRADFAERAHQRE
jgi:hypothetical protein